MSAPLDAASSSAFSTLLLAATVAGSWAPSPAAIKHEIWPKSYSLQRQSPLLNLHVLWRRSNNVSHRESKFWYSKSDVKSSDRVKLSGWVDSACAGGAESRRGGAYGLSKSWLTERTHPVRAREINTKALLSSEGGNDKVFWVIRRFCNTNCSSFTASKFLHCLHTDSKTEKVCNSTGSQSISLFQIHWNDVHFREEMKDINIALTF